MKVPQADHAPIDWRPRFNHKTAYTETFPNCPRHIWRIRVWPLRRAGRTSMQISLGLPDPPGSLLNAHPEEGAGRVRMQQGAQPSRSHSRCWPTSSGVRPPAQAGPVRHLDHSILWILSAQRTATSFNPATHLAWGDVAMDSHHGPRMVQIHHRVRRGRGPHRCNDMPGGRHPGICIVARCQAVPVMKSWFVTQLWRL